MLLKLLQRNNYINYLLHINYIAKKGFLSSLGWNKSFKSRKPLDTSNKPIPWFTYSCIHFLKNKNLKDIKVFEYGSGNSTLWFEENAQTIHSVEHDKDWYNFVKDKFKSSTNYTFKALSDNYSKAILEHPQSFDLVVVDGRNRVECVKNALQKVSEKGVILFDNAERPHYQEAFDIMHQKGFKRLDFFGIAPSICDTSLTSIFYKENNCLDI